MNTTSQERGGENSARRVDSYTTPVRRLRFTAGVVKLSDISVQLHVGGLDDLVPALDLLAHIGGRCLRRAADGLAAIRLDVATPKSLSWPPFTSASELG
jgi:hypothetical protein